jgi:hypothetical protein
MINEIVSMPLDDLVKLIYLLEKVFPRKIMFGSREIPVCNGRTVFSLWDSAKIELKRRGHNRDLSSSVWSQGDQN